MGTGLLSVRWPTFEALLLAVPITLSNEPGHVRLRFDVVHVTGDPLVADLLFEEAELQAGIKPGTAAGPGDTVIEGGWRVGALTIDEVLSAVGALLPHAASLVPLAGSDPTIRAVHCPSLLLRLIEVRFYFKSRGGRMP
jgi:hypothetical protein